MVALLIVTAVTTLFEKSIGRNERKCHQTLEINDALQKGICCESI